ncbi:hypothetical protein GJ629_10015 [Halapricum sp. CBA1109]|uniref:hypothetical protein n=1 Tax=Halapricum sp. CBA1109 TaxID=2668068 RepID=UPI0012F7534B|nr:hypothetical protein [Halapricum sp. CBA1109]MUV90182.1 hypothetical protein [Halapricum sp. CBA1109]
MDRTTLLTVVVVVLAGLAGCTSDVPTATPAPVPSPSFGASFDGPLPPGATAAGIDNRSALVDAHTASTNRTDGRITINRTVRRVDGGEALLSRTQTTVDFEADPARINFSQRQRSNGVYPNQTIDAYYSERDRFARITDENGSYFDRITETTVGEYRTQTAAYEVYNALGVGQWVPSERTTVGDSDAVVFRLTDVADTLDNATGAMAVTPDGAIRRLTLRTVTDGRAVRVQYRYDTFDDRPVDPPGWLAAAREAE